MVVPPGVAHTWWIGGEEEGHVLVEFRPALNTETFLETLYGLSRDGKVNGDGVLPLSQMRSSAALTRTTCPLRP
jgi:hypothetical protein